MGYKYRNDGTPDHVNSDDSDSVPTPQLAPRDATATKKPDPTMDKLTAMDKDANTHYQRVAVNTTTREMDPRGSNRLIGGDNPEQSDRAEEALGKLGLKANAANSALNAYKKSK